MKKMYCKVLGCFLFVNILAVRKWATLSCKINCKGSKCNDKGECKQVCNLGFAGKYCEKTCQSSCKSRVCTLDEDTGKIICSFGCVLGFCGKQCKIPCKDTMKSCDPNTCTIPLCNGSTYGDQCLQPCNCSGFSCDNTGSCLNYCLDGWFGANCTSKCILNCKRCEKDTGECIMPRDGSYKHLSVETTTNIKGINQEVGGGHTICQYPAIEEKCSSSPIILIAFALAVVTLILLPIIVILLVIHCKQRSCSGEGMNFCMQKMAPQKPNQEETVPLVQASDQTDAKLHELVKMIQENTRSSLENLEHKILTAINPQETCDEPPQDLDITQSSVIWTRVSGVHSDAMPARQTVRGKEIISRRTHSLCRDLGTVREDANTLHRLDPCRPICITPVGPLYLLSDCGKMNPIPLLCTSHTFSKEQVNDKCHVTDDGRLVNLPPKDCVKGSLRFKSYRGTRSIYPSAVHSTLTPVTHEPPLLDYWENEIQLELPGKKNMTCKNILELGILEEHLLDNSMFASSEERSWCLRLATCDNHGHICAQIWGKAKHFKCMSAIEVKTQGTYILKYSVVVDIARRRVGFVDMKTNEFYMMDAWFQQTVCPVFGVLSDPNEIKTTMKLVSGSDIRMTKEKRHLIYNSFALK